MNFRGKFKKEKGYLTFNNIVLNEYTYWLESELLKSQRTCELEEIEDDLLKYKFMQTSCCKIAPIVNENYCPNCGSRILHKL